MEKAALKFMENEFQIELVLRILAAAVCGAVIGYERKRRQKEAGVRTHVMVAMGAAVFTIVSKYGFFDVVPLVGVQADAARIASNIVTGVSFLGAGMIFVRSKSITGLTTAAGIWAVSGVGMAVGSGLYIIGLSTAGLILLIQYILHRPLQMIEGPSTREITVVLRNENEEDIESFLRLLKEYDKNTYYSQIEKREDKTVLIKFNIRKNQSKILEDVWGFMNEHKYIKSISV